MSAPPSSSTSARLPTTCERRCCCRSAKGRARRTGAGTRVDATARVEDSVLWDDVEVGAGAMLRECIVTDGARVPEDTSWIGVTLRRADGQLAPGERRIGDLAIASI